MSRALLLHLTGPLQSWGVAGTWTERDTHEHPTRSGLLGMVAAASGHPRGRRLDCFAGLRFTLRIDHAGRRETDYHTIGGGHPQQHTPPKAGDGQPRSPSQQRGTIVTRRTYLADAAFTVAITSHDTLPIERVHAWLSAPYWAPHLGRRSCPPAEPFLLGLVDEPEHALRHFPLHRHHPRTEGTVPVEFVTDATSGTAEQGQRVETLPTAPETFDATAPQHRLHTTRRWTEHLPAQLCLQHGTTYLDAAAQAITTSPTTR